MTFKPRSIQFFDYKILSDRQVDKARHSDDLTITLTRRHAYDIIQTLVGQLQRSNKGKVSLRLYNGKISEGRILKDTAIDI